MTPTAHRTPLTWPAVPLVHRTGATEAGRSVPRMLMRGLATLLAAIQVAGCATGPRPLPPAAIPAGVTDAERQECDGFARAEAEQKAATVKSKAGETASRWGTAVLVPTYTLADLVLLMLAVPLAITGGIVGTAQTERERSARRDQTYAQAMDECLKPIVLAQTLGPGHADTAAALRPVALAYAAQGRHERAEALLDQTLAIREGALGREHGAVLESLDDLTQFYADRGDGAKVEAMLRRGLEAREHALGPSHLEFADALERSWTLLRRANRDTFAAEVRARARTIREVAARLVMPGAWNFGHVTAGTKIPPAQFELTNRTQIVLHVRATIATERDEAFSVLRDGCQEPLPAGAACILEVEFVPAYDEARRSADLQLHIEEIGTLVLKLEGGG